MRRFAIVLLLAAAACGKTAVPATGDSGAQGKVLLGPTCPVEQVGHPCPDRPFPATIRIDDVNGHKVTTITTAADATFKVALAPGEYVFTPVLKTSPPTGRPQNVTVRAGVYTAVTIQVDSGIR